MPKVTSTHRLSGERRGDERALVDRNERIYHGDIDETAMPGLIALAQREQRGDDAVKGWNEIPDDRAYHRGRTIGVSADVHESAFGLCDDIERCSSGFRGGASSKPADARVDQTRVFVQKRFITESQPLHRPGNEVLPHDVRDAHEFPEYFLARIRHKLESDAAFMTAEPQNAGADASTTIVIDERRQRAARVAATRPLDLQNARAGFGKKHRRVRTRSHLREVQDDGSVQGSALCLAGALSHACQQIRSPQEDFHFIEYKPGRSSVLEEF